MDPKPIQQIEDAYKCPWCDGDTYETSDEEVNAEGTEITIHYECIVCEAEAYVDFSWKPDNHTAFDGEFLGGLWWPPDELQDYWRDLEE